MIKVRPLATNAQNKFEIFDEIFIFTVLELNFMLLDASVQNSVRSLLAWALIFLASFNILTHLSLLVYDTFKKARRAYQIKDIQKKRQALLEKRMHELKIMIEENSEKTVPL